MLELMSLWNSSVCVVDAKGKIVREVKVTSDPDALIVFCAGWTSRSSVCGARGRTAVAMVARRARRGGFRDGSPGDPPRKGSFTGDDNQDGPQGCARYRTVAPNGLVSAGSLQIGWFAGGPGAACRSQALARQITRCGIQHPRHFAWVRSEDGHTRVREL